MEDVDQGILTKVQKLLAKAESTNSQAEAETFFAKATELMEKHAIDEAMLAAAGKSDKKDKITSLRVDFGSTYWQSWRAGYIRLANAFNFRTLLMDNGKNGYAHLFGWESELDMAEMLFASLQVQVARSVNAHMQNYVSPSGMTKAQEREDRFKVRRSYIEAFVTEVANRIGAQRRATRLAESKARGEADGSLLPVLVNRDDEFKRFWDAMSAGTKSTKLRSPSVHLEGWGAGRRDGANADIGQNKVGGSKGALGS